MSLEFIKPARMDDLLVVATRVLEMRGATMTLSQAVMRDGEALVIAEVMVAATREGRATRVITQALARVEFHQFLALMGRRRPRARPQSRPPSPTPETNATNKGG
jgi:hypothetical protein